MTSSDKIIEEKISKILTRIREIRESKKMSREKLAVEINASKDTIYLLEKGERSLSLKWILMLSDALDCTLSQLLGEQYIDNKQVNAVNRDNSNYKDDRQFMVREYMDYAMEIMSDLISPEEKAKRSASGLLSEIYKHIYDIYEKKYTQSELMKLVEQKRNENVVNSAILRFLLQKVNK